MQQTLTTVYAPHSQLRTPPALARAMGRDVAAARELAHRLAIRDISARYRQSALGLVWAFLPPIATAAIFILLNRNQVISVHTPIPYPAFAIIGTVLWQIFLDALNAPLKTVVGEKGMLAKINFPREALVLSGLLQVTFDVGIKLIIIVATFVIFKIPVSPSLLLTPFALALLILLGTTIGLFLTPLGILYTDVTSALMTVTSLWFFATPVVYPPPSVQPMATLIFLNPVSSLLTAARELAIGVPLSHPLAFAVTASLTIVGLITAWIVFRLAMPILIERMSA
jgi:homopolymeric O-antigen transport system permease protein